MDLVDQLFRLVDSFGDKVLILYIGIGLVILLIFIYVVIEELRK